MTYTRKAVRGASWIFLMSMLASLIAYLTRIVLARHLGPADFGLFYAVFTFVIFFLFFRDLGFPISLVKFVAQFKAQEQYGKIKSVILTVFCFQLISSIIFAVVFYFLAPHLAVSYFKNPEASGILRIFILYIFGSVLFIISKDSLLGFQKTALFSLGEFLKNSLVFILILVFFYLGKGVYAPVYAFALVCFLLFLFYFPLLLREYPLFKYKVDHFSSASKEVILFTLPVFATAVGSKIIGYIDTLMLTYFRSLTEVGIYNVILPTSMLFLYFGTAIGSVVLPMVSELFTKGDTKRLIAGVEVLYKYLFAAILPFVAILFVFAPFFLQTFFGQDYVVGAFAMQILLVGVLLFTLAVINHNVFSALGKPHTVTVIILIAAVINAGLNFILIPRFGITGAAVSTTASYIAAFVMSVRKMRSYLDVKVPWFSWMKLVFAGGVFMLLLYKIPQYFHLNVWIELGLSVVIGLLVYVFLLYCFNVIDVAEIKRYGGLVR